VNGIGSDEIDGETPSMARETRALPKTYCIVPLRGHVFWGTLPGLSAL